MVGPVEIYAGVLRSMRHGASDETESALPLNEWFEEIICNTIGVGTWQRDGGQIGTFAYADGYLIIMQTPDVHMQIAVFLNQMAANDLARLQNRDELRLLLEEKTR